MLTVDRGGWGGDGCVTALELYDGVAANRCARVHEPYVNWTETLDDAVLEILFHYWNPATFGLFGMYSWAALRNNTKRRPRTSKMLVFLNQQDTSYGTNVTRVIVWVKRPRWIVFPMKYCISVNVPIPKCSLRSQNDARLDKGFF